MKTKSLISLLFLFIGIYIGAQNSSIDSYYQNSISLKLSNAYNLIGSNETEAGMDYLKEAISLALARSHDKQSALIVLNSNSFITMIDYYYGVDSLSQARDYISKHVQLCERVSKLSENTTDNFDYVGASYSIMSGLASKHRDFPYSITYTEAYKNHILQKEGYSETYFQATEYLIYEYKESQNYIKALSVAISAFNEHQTIKTPLRDALRIPAETYMYSKPLAFNNGMLEDIVSLNQIWIEFIDELYKTHDKNLINDILLDYDGHKDLAESIIYDQTAITKYGVLTNNCTNQLNLNDYDAAHKEFEKLYNILKAEDAMSYWPVVCFSYLSTLETLGKHSASYRFCKTFEKYIGLGDYLSEYETYFFIYYFGACDRFYDYEKVFEITKNQFSKISLESPLYWMTSRLAGSLHLKFGLYEEALNYMQEALSSYPLPTNPTATEMITYTGLISYVGEAQRRCGNTVAATEHFERAILLCEQYNIPNSKLHPSFNLGRLYHDQENYELARKYFKACTEIQSESNAQYNTSSPYSYLFDIERREGNIADARNHLQSTWSHILKEYYSMRDFLTINEQTQYWTFTGNIEYYGGLIADSGSDYCDIYYDMLLTSKGFLLNSEKEEYFNVINSGDSRLIELYNETKNSDTLNEVLINEYMALYRGHKFTPQIEQISWLKVRERLKKNDIAIELFKYTEPSTNESCYGALLLKKSSDSPTFIKLCKASDIESVVNKGSKIYTVDNLLYNLLWNPFEKHLKGIRNIYISPQGELHKINFSAIKDAKDKPLLHSYNIQRVSSTKNIKADTHSNISTSHLYGGLVYESSDSTMITEHRKYALWADISDNITFINSESTRRGWAYLPNTKIEVDNIEGILKQGNINTVKYEGVSGTEESFKSLSGQKPGIIHLATHGFYLQDTNSNTYSLAIDSKQSLSRSGLILSNGGRAWNGETIPTEVEDGILLADEIAKLNLDGATLLVMSACETALGDISGEGVYGLQRSFKIAGVETIIMSLWEIDDKATSAFMTIFYNNYLATKDKHQAFNKAQTELKKVYPNPYYWAAFIMLD